MATKKRSTRAGVRRPGAKGKKRLLGQLIISIIIVLLMIGAGKMNAAVINQGMDHIRERLAVDHSLKEMAVMAGDALRRGEEAVVAASSQLLGGGELSMSPPTDEIGVKEVGTDTDTILYQSEGELQVYAAAGGTVEAITEEDDGTKTICLGHGDAAETVYRGCTDVYVNKLDRIRKGELIASVAPGSDTALRFQVLEDGLSADPSDYLSR